MAFEKPGFERRKDEEEGANKSASVLGANEHEEMGKSALSGAEEIRGRDDAGHTPEPLTMPESMEPTEEEILASRLAEARRAYARVWLHEKQATAEEKTAVDRSYREAVSAMRAYRKERFEPDPSWNAGERARHLEALISATTSEEATRLIAARDAAKIAERDAAAAASLPRHILEDYREAISIFGRGARNVAEWYRSIPPGYKIAIGAALFGATVGGASLGLPLLAAAGGSAALATRILGGGAGALAAEGGMQWLQGRKARREIFGAKQESTWNPDLHFSWNPLQMAAGVFRREASEEQSQRWAEQLTAIVQNDDDARLNNAIVEQAGRSASERRARAIVAGIVFTAIAAGMPGRGFRFVGEQAGAGEVIRERARAWTHDLLHGGVAEAAADQGTPGAPAQGKGVYTKLRQWIRGEPSGPTNAPAETAGNAPPQEPETRSSGPKTDAAKPETPTARDTLTPDMQNRLQQEINYLRHRITEVQKEFDRTPVSAPRSGELLSEMEALKRELVQRDHALYPENQTAPPPAPRMAEPGPKAATQAPPAEPKPPAPPGAAETLTPEQRAQLHGELQKHYDALIKEVQEYETTKDPAQRAALAKKILAGKANMDPIAERLGMKIDVTLAPIQETGSPGGAPRTAEVVAGAKTDAAAKAAEKLRTVGKGEGAWQSVRRQFYERMRAHPDQFGLAPEDAKGLPDMDKLGRDTKAAKILNRETLATLKKAGYINPDGTTKIGMKPGAQIILNPDNSLELQGKGKLTYEFEKPKTGVGEPAGSRPRGGAAHPDEYITDKGAGKPLTKRESFDLNTEKPAHGFDWEQYQKIISEQATSEQQAGVEQAQAANIRSNLKRFGMTQREFGNIERMKTKTFIDELGRHAAQINEYRAHGAPSARDIFINNGALTTRGFAASLPEAGKYLDLSERLEQYLKPFDKATRKQILQEPIGKLLRALAFK